MCVRKIIETLGGIKQLRTIAMTTNGLGLTKLLVDLQRAGLNALNISLDTLQQKKYGDITKRDGRLLKRVLAGIDLAVQLGLSPIKVCKTFKIRIKLYYRKILWYSYGKDSAGDNSVFTDMRDG